MTKMEYEDTIFDDRKEDAISSAIARSIEEFPDGSVERTGFERELRTLGVA